MQDNIDPKLLQMLQQRSQAQGEQPYYKYGQNLPSVEQMLTENYQAPSMEGQPLKTGGVPTPLGSIPRPDGRHDFRHGAHVAGHGDGTSDDIPAMLADGEFVFPADVVAALGNGSTKAGTQKLYEMMHSIRNRARSAKPSDLAPDALKSPLDYLKGRKK